MSTDEDTADPGNKADPGFSCLLILFLLLLLTGVVALAVIAWLN